MAETGHVCDGYRCEKFGDVHGRYWTTWRGDSEQIASEGSFRNLFAKVESKAGTIAGIVYLFDTCNSLLREFLSVSISRRSCSQEELDRDSIRRSGVHKILDVTISGLKLSVHGRASPFVSDAARTHRQRLSTGQFEFRVGISWVVFDRNWQSLGPLG